MIKTITQGQVMTFDELDFPGTIPGVELVLSRDYRHHLIMVFNPDEDVYAMALG